MVFENIMAHVTKELAMLSLKKPVEPADFVHVWSEAWDITAAEILVLDSQKISCRDESKLARLYVRRGMGPVSFKYSWMLLLCIVSGELPA